MRLDWRRTANSGYSARCGDGPEYEHSAAAAMSDSRIGGTGERLSKLTLNEVGIPGATPSDLVSLRVFTGVSCLKSSFE